MGAKLWYLSWPAVSQISNFTVASFTANVCEKKAAPIVDSYKPYSENQASQSKEKVKFHKVRTKGKSYNKKPGIQWTALLQNVTLD